MSDTVLVALISGGSSALVGIVAILTQTYLMSQRFKQIERRLELIEADLKQFYRDILIIKQKIGIE